MIPEAKGDCSTVFPYPLATIRYSQIQADHVSPLSYFKAALSRLPALSVLLSFAFLCNTLDKYIAPSHITPPLSYCI